MNPIAILTNAKKKMEKMLDDFNKALPALKSLGLSVTDFGVNMGLLPEVKATLKGSFESMDRLKIKHLMDSNRDNKILGSILKALETASNIKGLIGQLMIKGIEVQVNLGILPKIGVRFIPAAESVSSVAAPKTEPAEPPESDVAA